MDSETLPAAATATPNFFNSSLNQPGAVRAGRLDVAIAFFSEGSRSEGELICDLPMRWLAHESFIGDSVDDRTVLFDTRLDPSLHHRSKVLSS
jgi:hypothetical protein